MGFFDLNCDWGDHGGQCYECWKCEPCCGQPCNIKDCCYCCCCWTCCASCNLAKLYGTATGEDECRIINQWLPWCLSLACIGVTYFCCIPLIVANIAICFLRTSTRTSLRRKHGIGEPDCNCCDCFLTWCPCTGPCVLCQECRGIEAERWDWIDQCARRRYVQRTPTENNLDWAFSETCNLCRPDGAENELIKANPYDDLSAEEIAGLDGNAHIGRIFSLIAAIIALITFIIAYILAVISSAISSSVLFAALALVFWIIFVIAVITFCISVSCCLSFNRQIHYVTLIGSESTKDMSRGTVDN